MIKYSELSDEMQDLIIYVKLRHLHRMSDMDLRHKYGIYNSIKMERLHKLLDELEKADVKRKK